MLQVEFIHALDMMGSLREYWEVFNARLQDHEAPFFQSYDWIHHVASTRLRQSADRFKLSIAVVRRESRIIGIWPLSLQRKAGTWIASSLDDPFGQFAGVVFESRSDIAPGVLAIIEALRKEGSADGLRIEGVIKGSALHEALTQSGARRDYLNDAVYLDLQPFASVEEYRATRNKKTLKNLRNLSNRLGRTLSTTHSVATSGADLSAMVTRTYNERITWLQTNARTSPAFRDADFRPLVESLTSSGVSTTAFAFVSEDDFLSAQWGFNYMGRYYSYLSAKNPKYDSYSPGRLHLGMVIENCMSRGIRAIDFMAPASGYKLDWADTLKQLDTFSMSFSVRGYLLNDVIANRIAPATRRASRMLPSGVRKKLIGLLNRG